MKNKYNDLENIDTLIEKLEAAIPMPTSDDSRINGAISKRKKQIAELKKIRDEAKKQSQIEEENDEIDEVIKEYKKLVKIKKQAINKRYNPQSSSNYSSESRSSESNYSYRPSYSSYSSESRSSESRW